MEPFELEVTRVVQVTVARVEGVVQVVHEIEVVN
jgi:hypothetical protein